MFNTMFDSTMEFITQAGSNSLFMFCFCNLIIVIILKGSKPSLNNIYQKGDIPLSTEATVPTYQRQEEAAKDLADENNPSQNAGDLSFNQEAVAADNAESDGDDNWGREEDEDDELRKRVEEFISKVNKGWREELFMTSGLV